MEHGGDCRILRDAHQGIWSQTCHQPGKAILGRNGRQDPLRHVAVGARRRITIGNCIHAEIAKSLVSGSLDLSQPWEVVSSGLADHRLDVATRHRGN
jgi:hypothetical protein